jgi:hypothetical protein
MDSGVIRLKEMIELVQLKWFGQVTRVGDE